MHSAVSTASGDIPYREACAGRLVLNDAKTAATDARLKSSLVLRENVMALRSTGGAESVGLGVVHVYYTIYSNVIHFCNLYPVINWEIWEILGNEGGVRRRIGQPNYDITYWKL